MNMIKVTVRFFILTLSLLFSLSQEVWADSSQSVEEAAPVECENKIDTTVNGLVCDFCARALEKVMGRRSEVSGIEVDLNVGYVGVVLKPNKTLDDATLTRLINDSGYDVVQIERSCS